jgi:protein SCO1/2
VDKIGSPVDYVLLFCCPYDPMTGKYTLTIYTVLKLAGGITLFFLFGLIFLLTRTGNKRKRKEHTLPQEATVSH